MTLEEIAVYGFYALLMAPAIGLALYALYLAIEEGGDSEMKTAIAKPLSAVVTIISIIVLFLSHDEVVVGISAYVFLVGVSVLLATTVIDMLEGW